MCLFGCLKGGSGNNDEKNALIINKKKSKNRNSSNIEIFGFYDDDDEQAFPIMGENDFLKKKDSFLQIERKNGEFVFEFLEKDYKINLEIDVSVKKKKKKSVLFESSGYGINCGKEKVPWSRLCPYCMCIVDKISTASKFEKCKSCGIAFCFLCLSTPKNNVFKWDYYFEKKKNKIIEWRCSDESVKNPKQQKVMLCDKNLQKNRTVYPLQTMENVREWHTRELRKLYVRHLKKFDRKKYKKAKDFEKKMKKRRKMKKKW